MDKACKALQVVYKALQVVRKALRVNRKALQGSARQCLRKLSRYTKISGSGNYLYIEHGAP